MLSAASATPSMSPSPRASSTTAATPAGDQPGGDSELAAAPAGGLPSGTMLGSTAGILVAFAVSVAFLIRERRMQRRERDEQELEHWTSYR